MIFTQEAPFTRKWFSGRSCIRSNWNLEMLIFEERGKPENPEKNLSEQNKEPTTNFTHSWLRVLSRTRATRWEASAITTTPSLLPMLWIFNEQKQWFLQARTCVFHFVTFLCRPVLMAKFEDAKRGYIFTLSRHFTSALVFFSHTKIWYQTNRWGSNFHRHPLWLRTNIRKVSFAILLKWNFNPYQLSWC